MPGSVFDTKVLLYVAAGDPAEMLIGDGGVISVQVPNEIANVARRKMGLSWTETREFLSMIRCLLPVQPIQVARLAVTTPRSPLRRCTPTAPRCGSCSTAGFVSPTRLVLHGAAIKQIGFSGTVALGARLSYGLTGSSAFCVIKTIPRRGILVISASPTVVSGDDAILDLGPAEYSGRREEVKQ